MRSIRTGVLSLSLVAIGLSAASVAAQRTPAVFADVNRTVAPDVGSDPSGFTRFGNWIYFSAHREAEGFELWRTDGSRAELFADLEPGPTDSRPNRFSVVNNLLVFATINTVYATDGTAITPLASARANGLEEFVGDALFVDELRGALWRTDGTATGTRQLFVATPGTGIQMRLIGEFRGAFYFTTWNAAFGEELWRTDGTSAGTTLFLDAIPGPNSSDPAGFAVLNGEAFFGTGRVTTGSGAIDFTRLWATDGTASGTRVVATLPQAAHGRVRFVATVGSRVLLARFQSPGPQLWSSDGTAAGTFGISGVSVATHEFAILNGELFFAGNTLATGTELWRSDATQAGTQLVADLRVGSSVPASLTVSGSRLFFGASAVTGGSNLWSTDGSGAGTLPLGRRVPDPRRIHREWLRASDVGGVWFSGRDDSPDEFEPWHTDGSLAGTQKLPEVNPPRPTATASSSPHALVSGGERLLFGAEPSGSVQQLLAADLAGTGVRQLTAHSVPSQLSDPVATDVGVFFVRQRTGLRSELWFSGGTPSTSRRLAIGLDPAGLRAVTGGVYFSAVSAGEGREPWFSNGFASGTRMVADLVPGLGGSAPEDFTQVGSRIFFRTTSFPSELWAIDGASPPMRVQPGRVVLGIHGVLRTGLVFYGLAAGGVSLLTGDGTSAGSVALLTRPGAPIPGEELVATQVRDRLFFGRLHGGGGDVRELWVTDGTPIGTRQVIDLGLGSSIDSMAAFHDRLLFRASTATAGAEPWISDGTSAGTRCLGDLEPGAGSSDPSEFVAAGSRFAYFHANQLATGRELWETDGTPAGTRVLEIWPQTGGSFPAELTVHRGRLLFAADDPLLGREPFGLGLGASSQAVGSGCSTELRLPELWADDPVLGSNWNIGGSGLRPGAVGGLLVSPGFGSATPFGQLGCTLYLDPGSASALAMLQANPQGQWSWSLTLPVLNALIGAPITLQAGFGPVNGQLDLTHGLQAVFGL